MFITLLLLYHLTNLPWCERECKASVLARRDAMRAHISCFFWGFAAVCLSYEHLEIVSVGRESLVPCCSLGKAALELDKIVT